MSKRGTEVEEGELFYRTFFVGAELFEDITGREINFFFW